MLFLVRSHELVTCQVFRSHFSCNGLSFVGYNISFSGLSLLVMRVDDTVSKARIGQSTTYLTSGPTLQVSESYLPRNALLISFKYLVTAYWVLLIATAPRFELSERKILLFSVYQASCNPNHRVNSEYCYGKISKSGYKLVKLNC
jgi:hypothetical protein